MPSCLKLMYEV